MRGKRRERERGDEGREGGGEVMREVGERCEEGRTKDDESIERRGRVDERGEQRGRGDERGKEGEMIRGERRRDDERREGKGLRFT